MPRRLRAVVLVLAVPIAILVVALAVQAHYDSLWRSALTTQVGALTDAQLARVALPVVCADPEVAPDATVCTEYAAMGWAIAGAVVSGLVGFALIGLITLGGRRARRERGLLLRWFRPMLYLTVVLATGLVVLDGVLAVAALFVGMDAFANGIWLGIVAAPAIALVVALRGMAEVAQTATRPARSSALAVPFDRSTQPRLFGFVDDLARGLGIDPPDNVIAGLVPSFYVTQVEVATPAGVLTGRTMYLSLPLCRLLSVDELRAVLGHELGHFAGDDTAWSTRFYPLYRGSTGALVVARASGRGFGALSTAPAAAILELFLTEFAGNEAAISRDRELAADQVGARIASPAALGSALVKLALHTQDWPATVQAAAEAVGRGEPVANMSAAYAARAAVPVDGQRLEALDQAPTTHPTDSHPLLSTRLAALGVSLADLRVGLDTAPGDPASTLFDRGETLEEALTSKIVASIAPGARALAATIARRKAAEEWATAFEARRAESTRTAAVIENAGDSSPGWRRDPDQG